MSEKPPRTPKRDEIAADLLARIEAGEFDSRLPSESQLQEHYGTSRLTVRAALDKLAVDGQIYPAQGRGWFVQRDIRLPFPLLRLDRGRAEATRDVWQTWLTAEGLRGSATLSVRNGLPPRHVRDHLALLPTAECIIRERVRMIDEVPVIVSTAYFPWWVAQNTELARTGDGDAVDMQNPSPVALLHRIGHGPVHDEDRIGARRPTQTESLRLALPPGSTVITVCRTSTDAAGNRVRCTADVIAGTRFYLIVDQQY